VAELGHLSLHFCAQVLPSANAVVETANIKMSITKKDLISFLIVLSPNINTNLLSDLVLSKAIIKADTGNSNKCPRLPHDSYGLLQRII
jgi:hypothetical protein